MRMFQHRSGHWFAPLERHDSTKGNRRIFGAAARIRTDGNSVMFEFDPMRGERGARLVIRCDHNGDVW
jgi:hypothetical protein